MGQLTPLCMAKKNGHSKSCQMLIFCRVYYIELDLSLGVHIATEKNEMSILKSFFENSIIPKFRLTNSLQVALKAKILNVHT